MEVSGRANGVSFSESDDWEQDEVKKLKYSCRLLGGRNRGIFNKIYCPKLHLAKGDNIHLYSISNNRTSVSSNRLQEFGKVARPGERNITKVLAHMWIRKGKLTGKIFSLLTFVAINTYSASWNILSSNKL